MRRGRLVLAVLALLVLGAGAAVFGPISALPARFALEECRRLALEDPGGRAILGIEDMARHTDGLLLSAHDRLAAEAGGDPAGGLYLLPLEGLSDATQRLTPLPGGPPAPHGVAVFGVWVGVVERQYDASGHTGTDIALYQFKDGRLEEGDRHTGPRFCAANDIAWLGGWAHATFDRTSCPGLSMFEALGLSPGGRLARLRLREAELPIGQGLRHANGLVALGSDRIAVAETRGGGIRVFGGLADVDPQARVPAGWTTWSEAVLPTPGAPDNLTLAPDGRIVAALHPSLPRLGLYRYGWQDRAPSRIVALDPVSGVVEVLMDDPGGARFSGATVGLMLEDGRLVAGSVRDEGLLICGAAS